MKFNTLRFFENLNATVLHYNILSSYNAHMEINVLAGQFKALSEPVRLRILYLLLETKEICVCDLMGSLDLTQSVVSRHLAYLKNHHFIESRRDATWIYYKIKPVQADIIGHVLNSLLVNGRTSIEFKKDLEKLETIAGKHCK